MSGDERGSCLVCSETSVEPFLDLGVVPLANSLLDKVPSDPAEEVREPLRVGYCHNCHAVQLLDLVPPERMFSEYVYFSSFSDAFLKHSAAYAEDLMERFGLGSDSFVLEVASNDGYLLKNLVKEGVPVLGVEPARNIAKVAREAGIPTLCEFFGPDVVPTIRGEHGQADVILGNNVLAHVPTLVPFLTAARDLLKPDGVCVFEFPWLRELVRNLEFDTIYHEHVYYFSLSAVRHAARAAGLDVFDVQIQPVHGGSLRVFLQAATGARPVTPAVEDVLGTESAEGLTGPEAFRKMGGRVQDLRKELLSLLKGLRRDGKRVVGYGASAKGSTLLNYCGIGAELLDYIVDRSTVKQGRIAPGVHLAIEPVERLLEDKPDFTLLLAWNFSNEIRAQQAAYEAAGGRFIHPVPEPRILKDNPAATGAPA